MKNLLNKLLGYITSATSADEFVFKKVVPVRTPSGYQDNGQYMISDDGVSFPIKKLREAIIEEVTVKMKKENSASSDFDLYKAVRVTIDGNHWLIANERAKSSP